MMRLLTGVAAMRGRDHMQYYGCTSCHSTPAFPQHTELSDLHLIGWGFVTLANTPQHLALWIQHPQQIHPGTAMPELNVTNTDANDMAAYLEKLR